MSAINLRSITKSFGDTPVLSSIDLSIANGEFLTLVGPSGCGKSTLLRILAGLEAPDSGFVEIADQNVNKMRPADRNLAMVFQSYALYPHLTVEQNIMTPLRLRNLSLKERLPFIGPMLAADKYRQMGTQVRETAQTLQIDHLLKRKPGQLSGGQRQRVALGRAMVRNPAAFLMDEPLSNLDAALRIHMRSELAELHRALKTTFVYVTHDQAEALTMSDRMAVMMGGHILQLGTPEEIYNNPAEIRVAQFVGTPRINLLPGELDSTGHARSGGVVLSRTAQEAPSSKVTIGLRPEHLSICGTQTADSLKGRVVHKENLGADIYLHVAVHDGAHRMVIRTSPQNDTSTAYGEDVWFRRFTGQAFVFDETGKRLQLHKTDNGLVSEVA